jgi:transcriptional regulator with XRE-family HTH domain
MFINIEVERLRHQLSRKDMATTLDISVAMLNDWICKRKPIPADKLRALSRLLGCSLDYLLKEWR